MFHNHPLIKEYIDKHKYNIGEYDYPSDKVAVIVETRKLPHLRWVINNIQHHTGWRVIFYCSEESKLYIPNVELRVIDDLDYNSLLKSIEFWESFEEEHILIFQSDSFMLESNIDFFLQFDYIGAPWNWSYDPNFKDPRYPDLSIFKNGGNGGFSLRKKSKMIEILSKIDTSTYINEDMLIAPHLDYIDIDIKKKFCVETIFFSQPLAIHAIHKYMSDSQIKQILNI